MTKQPSLFPNAKELRREAIIPPLTELPPRPSTQEDREKMFISYSHRMGSSTQRGKALQELGINSFFVQGVPEEVVIGKTAQPGDINGKYSQTLKDLKTKYRTSQ